LHALAMLKFDIAFVEQYGVVLLADTEMKAQKRISTQHRGVTLVVIVSLTMRQTSRTALAAPAP
jgi:hypothetical protein